MCFERHWHVIASILIGIFLHRHQVFTDDAWLRRPTPHHTTMMYKYIAAFAEKSDCLYTTAGMVSLRAVPSRGGDVISGTALPEARAKSRDVNDGVLTSLAEACFMRDKGLAGCVVGLRQQAEHAFCVGDWEQCMECCEEEAAAWQEEEQMFAQDPNCSGTLCNQMFRLSLMALANATHAAASTCFVVAHSSPPPSFDLEDRALHLAAAISASELGGVVAHVVAAVERLVCMRRLLVKLKEWAAAQPLHVKVRVASSAASTPASDEAAAAAAVLNPLLASSWQSFVAAFDLCGTPSRLLFLILSPAPPLDSNGTLEFVGEVRGQPEPALHVAAGGTTFDVLVERSSS